MYDLDVFKIMTSVSSSGAPVVKSEKITSCQIASNRTAELYTGAVCDPVWINEDTLAFRSPSQKPGVGKAGFEYEVFMFHVDRGEVVQYSNAPDLDDGVIQYAFAGKSCIIIRGRAGEKRTDADKYPASYLDTGRNLTKTAGRQVMSLLKDGVERELTDIDADWRYGPDGYKMTIDVAPDGRTIMLLLKSGGILRPMFMDADSGVLREVYPGAQIDINSTVFTDKNRRSVWSPDGRVAILANVVLSGDSSSHGVNAKHVIAADLNTRTANILMTITDPKPSGGSSICCDWYGTNGTTFILRNIVKGAQGSDVTAERAYMRCNGAFERIDGGSVKLDPIAATGTADDASVVVREDINNPPFLVMRIGKTETALSSPDTNIANIHWCKTKVVEWEATRGARTIRGLLTQPTTESDAGVYPLVIQLGADFERFCPDGSANYGFAAQSLVAQGFKVLQLDVRRIKRPSEIVEVLDEVIDYLEKTKVSEGSRYGIVGHSRTGYYVNYLNTHPGMHPPSAAVICDSATYGFSEYVQMLRKSPSQRGLFEDISGSFWANRERWMEDSPAFNLHRSTTPTLYQYSDNERVSAVINEIVGSHIGANVPFEMLLFPHASHQLSNPKQRVASMEATIAWMRFWLKNELPNDPDRATRWVGLRKQEDEVLKTPPSPKGHWQFVPDSVQPEWHPPGEGAGDGRGGRKEASAGRNEEAIEAAGIGQT